MLLSCLLPQVNVHLIVNPNAGRRKGLATAEHARSVLESAGLTVVTHISTVPGETVSLAAEITGSGRFDPATISGVVALGGDGTLFEMINGLLRGAAGPGTPTAGPGTPPRLPFPIGQIPVGTGNSFIRDLEISRTEDALQAVLGGRTRPVDLGTLRCDAGFWYFINLLGAGFVSAVAHRAGRYKRLGALSYIIGVLQETIALAPQDLTITVDGVEHKRHGIFVEICNSRYTGGNMLIAPDARIDDGLLDVIFMTGTSRRKLLSLFPRIFSGTHVQDPVIEVFRGSRVTVRTKKPWLLTPDGETFGSTPIEVGILPHHLEIFCR